MHPQMWEDHADKAGVIGEITKADISRDDFFVSYGGKQDHLHSADAILMLKPPEAIYDYLHQHAIDLTPQDFKDLKSIALLLDHGSERHKRTAMELVQKNDSLHFKATNKLEDLLGLQQSRSLKR
jgi:hypothetical protein